YSVRDDMLNVNRIDAGILREDFGQPLVPGVRLPPMWLSFEEQLVLLIRLDTDNHTLTLFQAVLEVSQVKCQQLTRTPLRKPLKLTYSHTLTNGVADLQPFPHGNPGLLQVALNGNQLGTTLFTSADC